jgi:hypothetical protein
MALKMEFTTDNGFLVSKEDSYLKISHLSGNKSEMYSIIEYQNAARKNCGTLTTTFIPNISVESGDFIHQAYEAFKLLPELATAEDA